MPTSRSTEPGDCGLVSWWSQRRVVGDPCRLMNQTLCLLAPLTICLTLAGCLGSECVNEVSEVLESPDGTKKVVVFSRNCGATTGFNTQASIVETKQELPDASGNAFVVDKGAVKLSWKKDGGILVVFDRGVRMFKQESAVSGVAIEYREE